MMGSEWGATEEQWHTLRKWSMEEAPVLQPHIVGGGGGDGCLCDDGGFGVGVMGDVAEYTSRMGVGRIVRVVVRYVRFCVYFVCGIRQRHITMDICIRVCVSVPMCIRHDQDVCQIFAYVMRPYGFGRTLLLNPRGGI